MITESRSGAATAGQEIEMGEKGNVVTEGSASLVDHAQGAAGSVVGTATEIGKTVATGVGGAVVTDKVMNRDKDEEDETPSASS